MTPFQIAIGNVTGNPIRYVPKEAEVVEEPVKPRITAPPAVKPPDDHCQWCETPMVKSRSSELYCSHKCRNARNHYVRMQRKRAARVEVMVQQKCEHCKQFMPATAHGLARYCTDSCQEKARQKRKREARHAGRES